MTAARVEVVMVSREEAQRVIMAARDLAGWMLSEEATRRIEVLWRNEGGVQVAESEEVGS